MPSVTTEIPLIYPLIGNGQLLAADGYLRDGVQAPSYIAWRTTNKITSDHLLLLFLSHTSTDWVTVTGGWTLICQGVSGGSRAEVYYKWGQVGEDSDSNYYPGWTVSSGKAGYIHIIALSGCDKSNPIGQYSVKENTSGRATDSITTTSDRSVVFMFVSEDGTPSSVPYNFDQQNIPDFLSIAVVDSSGTNHLADAIAMTLLQTAGPTGTGTWTGTATPNTVGIVLEIIPEIVDVPDEPGYDLLITGIPTNTSAAAALEIPNIPYTVKVNLADSPYPNDLYFKIPSGAARVIGMYAWCNPFLGNYAVRGSVSHGLVGSLVLDENFGFAYGNKTARRGSIPQVLVLQQGENYYVRIYNAYPDLGSDRSIINLIVSFYDPPKEGVRIGDLMIYNDIGGLPSHVIDAGDGHTRELFSPFAAGEEGDISDDGVILMENTASDDGTFDLILYDPYTLTELLRLEDFFPSNLLTKPEPRIYIGHASNFYVLYSAAGDSFWTLKMVSKAGVVGGTTWTIPKVASYNYAYGMAVSPDETILYYIERGDNEIKRWDLVNDISLPSLIPDGFDTELYYCAFFEDLRVDRDGNLLVPVFEDAEDGSYDTVLVVSPAGTLIRAIRILNEISGDELNHLQLADTDDTFWVWIFGVNSTDRFEKYSISTGELQKTITADEGYGFSLSASPFIDEVNKFGIPNSCTFFVLRQYVDYEPPIPPTPALLPINPWVILQWSDDNGNTWSKEHWEPVGRAGEFMKRMIWNRLGVARNRVFRIIVSDPCKWIFTQAQTDIKIGTGRR